MHGPLLRYIGRGQWRLEEDYQPPHGPLIPKGFETDLDSVPRIPIFHAWFKGRAVSAAVPHDYMYRNGYDRTVADNVFMRNMVSEGVRKRYRVPVYWAVRLFGGRMAVK